MFRTWVVPLALKQRQNGWPHGYEDLDERFFKRARRLALSLIDGEDEEPDVGVPDPGMPEPPVPNVTTLNRR